MQEPGNVVFTASGQGSLGSFVRCFNIIIAPLKINGIWLLEMENLQNAILKMAEADERRHPVAIDTIEWGRNLSIWMLLQRGVHHSS